VIRAARPATVSIFVLVASAGSSCRSRPAPSRSAFDAGTRFVRAGEIIEAFDEAGRRLSFRVDSVEADAKDPEGEISLYELSLRGPEGAGWVPYCARDREGKSRAIPLLGSWTNPSTIAASPDQVTFACTAGVLAKCVRQGYKPWKVTAGRSPADLHAACVRMFRADYCGDGRGHTREGTLIDSWDVAGIQKREQSEDAPEVFEAAWSAAGAVWVNVPRWEDDVDRLVTECPAKLRGHTSKDAKLSIEEVAHRFPEAVLFNARFVRAYQRMDHAAPPPQPSAPAAQR
jgi:hypothetical protein